MMPIRVQHKKGEHVRKRSKPARKKIRKELAIKQSEISGSEDEADKKEELKSKEENHTFPEDVASPVTSFAKICQVSCYPYYININCFISKYIP